MIRAHNIYQDEGFLYVVGSNQFNGGIAILRLGRDPWNPEFVGAYSQAYVHDVYVRNSQAYAAEIDNRRLRIISIGSSDSHNVLGERTYAGAFTHNTWLNDAGDVCFTTDEVGQAYIIAWDVSDPENIEELDRIRSSLSRGSAAPHNVHVINDFLVTSYYGDGVQIVDASRPHNLVEVGHFDTAPNKSTGLVGCWGAYPFLPSGHILATDLSNGLFVLKPTYRRAAFFEGSVVDAVTGAVIPNVSLDLANSSSPLSEVSREDGSFAIGFADEGEKRIIFSHPDYQPDTLELSLTSGEVFLQEVALAPRNVFFGTYGISQSSSGCIGGSYSQPGCLPLGAVGHPWARGDCC